MKFVVKGGATLSGEIYVSGAKNAALPIIASSLLFDTPVTIKNVPMLIDVKTMTKLLEEIGSTITWKKGGLLLIKPGIKSHTAPYEIVEKMRASIYVLGPILAKTGFARVSYPGGCDFGPRPINLHIDGLKKMGAKVTTEHGYIVARGEHLHGMEYVFQKKTVGGTIHLMMTASLINDRTILKNVALEPEVIQVADFLKRAGADIQGIGTDSLVIVGKDKLKPEEVTIISDRIEAGTFIVTGCLAGDRVIVRNAENSYLSAVINKARESGCNIDVQNNSIVVGKGKNGIKPLNIETAPYPGFPTDMQAQFMSLLSVACGTSIVSETIYPSRFRHAYELNRLGANIEVRDGEALIRGVNKLQGAEITATDLRASASLVIAGLIAEGETVINDISHLDRGYEHFEEKLNSIGANIQRV